MKKFQFLHGAIKGVVYRRVGLFIENFNSYMVRLRVLLEPHIPAGGRISIPTWCD